MRYCQYELLYKKRSSQWVTKVLHSFYSSILQNERRRMKLKMHQDRYLCFGIIFNHAKFLKDLTFNVLANRYQIHRKNDLMEVKEIAHLNRLISLTNMHQKVFLSYKTAFQKNLIFKKNKTTTNELNKVQSRKIRKVFVCLFLFMMRMEDDMN